MIFCQRCGKRNPDDAQNCANCGCSLNTPVVEPEPFVPEQTTEQAPDTQEYATRNIFSNKRKWIIAGVIAVIAIVVIIIVFSGQDENAQFKMNGAGDLYLEGQTTAVIEIPRDYDGRASGFEDTNQLTGHSFSYNGSLKTFIKYHSWIFNEDYALHEISKRVYCEDYEIEFSVNGNPLGADISYKDGGAQLIYPRFKIYDRNGSEVASFERFYDVYEWLN